jgi:dihydroorotase
MASRVGWTPYDGFEAIGWPMATVLRGQIFLCDGQVLLPGQGKPIEFMETLAPR